MYFYNYLLVTLVTKDQHLKAFNSVSDLRRVRAAGADLAADAVGARRAARPSLTSASRWC